ncbi:MAG: nitrous oxide reductase accessory protein NosL [Desulfuromonadaceae bacterium]|nr:nitrous oxide reductase accessory protein NosL [Desulfuromonadaceae bacterium]
MKRLIPVVILICFLMMSVCLAANKAAVVVPPGAKCPVCGMFVAKFPDWTATAHFKDGATFYYDGPKDMFSHYLNTSRYTPGKLQADIVALTVKEYYSLERIDARTAFFVSGSDVYGPMGNELVPFKTEKDARSFKLDHKGKFILRFNEISRQTIQSLN